MKTTVLQERGIAMLEEADKQAKRAGDIFAKKERASLKLYAELLVDEIIERGEVIGLHGDLTDKMKFVFDRRGAEHYHRSRIADFIYGKKEEDTLFNQWLKRVTPSNWRIFQEVLNDVLMERESRVFLRFNSHTDAETQVEF